jgi:phospholipid transport system substrate-binding protein
MMTKIRTLFALAPALLALLLAPFAAAADPQAEARAVIETTVEEVIAILNDESRDTAARRGAIEKVAEDRFDFRTMSKLVLAKNWKRLSKEQQAEFVTEFTEYLANDYGSRIERYEQEQVDIVGERVAKRGDVTVKTRIVGGANNDAEVDYRMRNRDGGWKIIDVVIEGISLVANFRDQFRDVMGKEGPVTLIDKLKEKNAGSHGA